MIIIYGASPSVTRVKWNNKFVWTTGLHTAWEVIRTYMDVCILVVNEIDDLKPDMEGFYVINEGGCEISEEAVLRGAMCLNCTMKEGLWKLRNIINKYK